MRCSKGLAWTTLKGPTSGTAEKRTAEELTARGGGACQRGLGYGLYWIEFTPRPARPRSRPADTSTEPTDETTGTVLRPFSFGLWRLSCGDAALVCVPHRRGLQSHACVFGVLRGRAGQEKEDAGGFGGNPTAKWPIYGKQQLWGLKQEWGSLRTCRAASRRKLWEWGILLRCSCMQLQYMVVL